MTEGLFGSLWRQRGVPRWRYVEKISPRNRWSVSRRLTGRGPRPSATSRNPKFRSYLEESLRKLDAKEPAPLLTREEFLAQTLIPDE